MLTVSSTPLHQNGKVPLLIQWMYPKLKIYFTRSRVITKLYVLISPDTEDAITFNGMEKFIQALDVDPNDISLLILGTLFLFVAHFPAWELGCQTMGEMTRQEFVEGLTTLK